MKFTVNIESDSTATHPRNVAAMLQRISLELIDRSHVVRSPAYEQIIAELPPTVLEGVVRDVKGVVVGTWKYDPNG